MTTLVIGPTCSGKSTLIHQHGPNREVVYGFEIARGSVPTSGIIHYNMLYFANSHIKENPGDLVSEWDFFADPVFSKIIDSQTVSKATVIVTPAAELKQRMANRTLVEPTRLSPGRYPNELWINILNGVDLFAVYERLFDALDRAQVPVEVLYSSSEFGTEEIPVFLPSDRVFTHHNLRGRYFSLPPESEIQEFIRHPGCQYQSVLLHRGNTTNPRGHAHVSGGRSATFATIRDRNFVGRSVLDVGCALGDMLFRAERYGATRLLGIEMKANRFEAAEMVAKLLHSNAVFKNSDFLDIELDDSFDDVLLLNVLHHVSDFRNFLIKAASLAKERLIVEFPTLRDQRFQSLLPFADDIQHLPVVGISSDRVDQTFVFTRVALERIVADAGKFVAHWFPSSIAEREIGIFSRTG